MFRFLSLAIRKLQYSKSQKKTIAVFNTWKQSQKSLPGYACKGGKLLIVRLDDIGDYLLFRNSLAVYKNAPLFNGYTITLLGNIAWKQLFVSFDESLVDKTIWVDKNKYLQDEEYRNDTWKQLREEGFKKVICPSCTRPLLFDDLCALATGCMDRVGAANTFRHELWNRLSDGLYTSLYQPTNQLIHEFYFNQHFVNWCGGTNFFIKRPQILSPAIDTINTRANYILCFIGAATRSRRWPTHRWIEFIQLYKKTNSQNIILAGGKAEKGMANDIQKQTGVESIVGEVSLDELVLKVAQSSAVITNNTMAAHLSASCNKPTIIIANGDNYIRFTEYKKAGIEGVETLYPKVFWRKRKKTGDVSLHYIAVTSDIAQINASQLLKAFQKMLSEVTV